MLLHNPLKVLTYPVRSAAKSAKRDVSETHPAWYLSSWSSQGGYVHQKLNGTFPTDP